ncbi:MAG: FAD-binding oxidoreductase, partial [Anaerolineales bacterium]
MDSKKRDLARYQASQELVHALRGVVEEVHFDRMTRLVYSTDASIYQMIPVGVAIPRNAEEVSAAIEIASKHDVPVLARGGGSSLAGQAVGNALILDLSRYMNEIIEIDPEALRVRTQPGITRHALNKSLLLHGLMYGPDPASGDRATVGGMLANNSTGAHSILYGMTDQHVISTDVVLADGSTAFFGAVEKKGLASRERRP